MRVCWRLPCRASSSPCIWGSCHWGMQNCSASSTNPTPPCRWSGFLEAHRCAGTRKIPKLAHTLMHTESCAETMSEYQPISFQKNSFEDDVHHALYLRPLLLQLKEHMETSWTWLHTDFLSAQPKWHCSHLCDRLLYSLQLQCAPLSHRLWLLHLAQFLTVFNADAQAQGHTNQGAQQLHRLTDQYQSWVSYWMCLCIRICVCLIFLTCETAGVSEGPYVRVGQLGEQWNEGVHQITVKYDTVLTLGHQHWHKVTELGVKPAAVWSRLYQRILHTILQRRERERTDFEGQQWLIRRHNYLASSLPWCEGLWWDRTWLNHSEQGV